MFDASSEIYELDNNRLENYNEVCARQTSFLPVPKPTGCMMIKGLFTMFFRNLYKKIFYPNYRFEAFTINQEEISKQKSQYSPDFISTNDIINSWFLSKTGNGFCLEAVNARNRIEGCTNQKAGNYLNLMVLHTGDYQTPLDHRNHLNGCLNKEKKQEYVPNYQKLFGGLGGISTNWTTFYKPVQLPGFEERIHLPILNLPPPKLAGVTLMQEKVLLIFKSNVKDTAVMLLDWSKKVTNYQKEAIFKNTILTE